MKKIIIILIVAMTSITWKIEKQNNQKPCVAFSFDDGNPNDILNYKGADWNSMIVDQLKKKALFKNNVG